MLSLLKTVFLFFRNKWFAEPQSDKPAIRGATLNFFLFRNPAKRDSKLQSNRWQMVSQKAGTNKDLELGMGGSK